jgi:predicted glycosyltransferase
VGAGLVRAAIEAARLRPDLAGWCVITGPNLPQEEYDSLQADIPANVTLHRFRTDFASLLASARLSISQAGYNTVADILQARCRALLVPFAAAGETEQTVRAGKLEGMGRAIMLPETDLSGAAVAAAIERAFAQNPRSAATRIATNGADRSAEILAELTAG